MQINKGYFLVFLTAIISGFSIFINQFGVKIFNPFIFTGLKNLAVAILLSCLILLFKDWKILSKLTKKQWGLLVLIGLVGGSIPFLLFFKGLSMTNAAMGSFLQKTMFLYVAALAVIFLKEKIDKRFFLGGIILLFGNLLFLKKISPSINQGDILILLATVLWAVENTFSKYVLKDLPGRTVAWGRMFFGSLFIFIFLFFSGQLAPLSYLNLHQMGWLAVSAVLLFGYVVTWYCGLKLVSVSKATVILLLGSPITTLLSFIQTGQINIRDILASLIIVLGIVIVLGLKQIWNFAKAIKKLIYARA